jgi:putative inorganic carbon (hco3(-)) transporter
LIMCGHKERLNSAIWTIVLSLGFYGVRGAFGTVLHGGMYRIYGPERTFIADNNDLALALVTVIPLAVYLLMCSRRRVVRLGLFGLIVSFAVAVIGTYSRAGLLALVATGLALLWKTPYRLRAIFALCLCGFLLYEIAPAQWFSRMGTISKYSEDQSAQARLNSWRFAMNLAADHPLMGGGFEAFSPELFQRYAPEPDNYHAAHSIYFKVLGEQGAVGLALFLLLWVAAWKSAGAVRRRASLNEETAWAGHLTSMVQVAFIAYGVGGAFGNLCYFDLPYHLMALVVGTKVALSASMADDKAEDGFSADVSNMVHPCEAS